MKGSGKHQVLKEIFWEEYNFKKHLDWNTTN